MRISGKNEERKRHWSDKTGLEFVLFQHVADAMLESIEEDGMPVEWADSVMNYLEFGQNFYHEDGPIDDLLYRIKVTGK